MTTVNVDVNVDVDIDLDEFDDDEVLEYAISILKRNTKLRREFSPDFLDALGLNDSIEVDAILAAFNPINGADLDRALQAIRDRSAHDLQMLLS